MSSHNVSLYCNSSGQLQYSPALWSSHKLVQRPSTVSHRLLSFGYVCPCQNILFSEYLCAFPTSLLLFLLSLLHGMFYFPFSSWPIPNSSISIKPLIPQSVSDFVSYSEFIYSKNFIGSFLVTWYNSLCINHLVCSNLELSLCLLIYNFLTTRSYLSLCAQGLT